jgi:hypothetical protein
MRGIAGKNPLLRRQVGGRGETGTPNGGIYPPAICSSREEVEEVQDQAAKISGDRRGLGSNRKTLVRQELSATIVGNFDPGVEMVQKCLDPSNT